MISIAKCLLAVNLVVLISAVSSLTDKIRVNTADSSVQLEILLAHNWYRQRAVPKPLSNLADLRWNHKAAASAAKVVRSIAKTCSLQHSQTSERTIDGVACGENLAFRSSSSPTMEKFPWDAAVSMWGDERLIPSWKYNCASDRTFHEWGHYTQVVSQRTTSVGCAAHKCKSQPNAVVFVCHYCAAGNFAPLARPYAAAAEQKADCNAPRPAIGKKPSRTTMPTASEASNSIKYSPLEDFAQSAFETPPGSPAKLIFPPLQEPDGGSSIDTNRFDTQKLIVFKHNLYRRTALPLPIVPLADVVWNPDAAATAAKISARLAEKCTLSTHSTNYERIINNQQCGENLGLSLLDANVQPNDETRPWARTVSSWGDQRNTPAWQFGCSHNSSFTQWGHYTQLVSERTTSVGCAATPCTSNPAQAVFACLYCAAGNYPPYNEPYRAQTKPICSLEHEDKHNSIDIATLSQLNGSAPLAATEFDSSPKLSDAVAPSTNSIDAETPDVRTVILQSHNQFRRDVCPRAQTPLVDVTWDFAASTTAQTIAYRLANSGGCALQHSQAGERNNCGENLGFLGGSLLTAGVPWQRVVGLWGNERDKFSYAQSPMSKFSDYGHYTQVVWEQTKSVGCAAVQCADTGSGMQSAVFVCHYCPAGNYPPINKPYVADPTSPTSGCAVSNAIDTKTTTTTFQLFTNAATAPPPPPPPMIVDITTTSASSTSPPSTTTTQSFPRDSLPSNSSIDTTDPNTQDYIVNLHNIARQSTSNPSPAAPLAALTWNDELAAAARLVLGNTALNQNFKISCTASSPTFPAIANPIQLAGRICTANTGASTATAQQPWQQVVQLWTSDKAKFVYGCSDPTQNFDEWGHYTQIVDGMTSEVGCAAKPCAAGDVLSAVMFCVYCDSAKSKPDYALNKPYDASAAEILPRCNAAVPVVNNDLSASTTTTSTTTTTTTTQPPPPVPPAIASPATLPNIDTNEKSIQHFLLQIHNMIRQGVHPAASPTLPQLTWNAPLATTLQQTAAQISQTYCRPGVAFAPTSSASSTANTCGINVAVASTANNPWEAAVGQWSAGRTQFQLGCSQPQDFNLWGQYTQMLGKHTRTLACAAAICSSDSSSAVMVCGYCGAGNVAGSVNQPYFAARQNQPQCNNMRRSAQLQSAVVRANDTTAGAAQHLAQLLLAPVFNVQNIMLPNTTDFQMPPILFTTTTAAPIVDPVAQLMAAVMNTNNVAANVSSAVEAVFDSAVASTTILPTTTTSTSAYPIEALDQRASSPTGTGIELTCPTATLDNAISPWMALPNYNRCIIFVRGPTGRGKFQQCAEKVANGSLLRGDSEALKSLIVLLRQKLTGDANTVIYEVSPFTDRGAQNMVTRHRRHTPELNNRGWSVQAQQHSTIAGGESSLPKSSLSSPASPKVQNDFRSLLARTARDRKFLDVILGMDPSIEERALDNAGRAVLAQDALAATSGRNNSSRSSTTFVTGSEAAAASGRFVSPLVERFLHLLPPDECSFVGDDGFQQHNELACGIYQWTARHGYICQAPLGNNVKL